ncbi:hypothetical protein [Paraburkholderia dinghuensis]|uniref:Uncharacterized protein n=1 Tax=Paraburkholderia dinghuensis TaxID=2305225 RepID=A0A3N6NKY2_9BURK|nr:hypothetical protein [Paraburkholderia dinghuensis]RQH09597.1 hypothetical protein D1Y85_00040 [Paraburkholderia dinghuensis]
MPDHDDNPIPDGVDPDRGLEMKGKEQTMPVQYFSELPLFAGLSVDLRELVGNIEHHAGRRIAVERTEIGKMACDFDRHVAVIQVPDAGPPRVSSVFHELLHLKRYFVDGVPKLRRCGDEHRLDDETTQFECLDSQIEHLFIVPRELARYRNARGYWEVRVGAVLNDPGLADDVALVASEFVHRVLNGGVLSDAAQAQIQRRGLVDACNRFHQAADESKEAATLCLFETFELGREKLPRVCLDYFARPQEVPLASIKGAPVRARG